MGNPIERGKDRLGIEIYLPRIGVVIGRGGEFKSEVERHQITGDNPDLKIVTYDDLLNFPKRLLLLVQQPARENCAGTTC